MKEGQMVTIQPKNGLSIDGIYLTSIGTSSDKTWHICYSQGRIVECDKDMRELKSHDLIIMLSTSFTNLQDTTL